MTGDGGPGSLDLLRSNRAPVKSLQSEFAEIQFVISIGDSAIAAALNLSVLYAFWH